MINETSREIIANRIQEHLRASGDPIRLGDVQETIIERDEKISKDEIQAVAWHLVKDGVVSLTKEWKLVLADS